MSEETVLNPKPQQHWYSSNGSTVVVSEVTESRVIYRYLDGWGRCSMPKRMFVEYFSPASKVSN